MSTFSSRFEHHRPAMLALLNHVGAHVLERERGRRPALGELVEQPSA